MAMEGGGGSGRSPRESGGKTATQRKWRVRVEWKNKVNGGTGVCDKMVKTGDTKTQCESQSQKKEKNRKRRVRHGGPWAALLKMCVVKGEGKPRRTIISDR
jgi:hypothetical protein